MFNTTQQQRFMSERISKLETQLLLVKNQLASHQEQLRGVRLEIGENMHDSPNDINTRLYLLELEKDKGEPIDIDHIRAMALRCPYLKNNDIGCPFIDSLVPKQFNPPSCVYAGIVQQPTVEVQPNMKITLEDAEAMVRAMKAQRQANNSSLNDILNEHEMNEYIKANKSYINPEKLPQCIGTGFVRCHQLNTGCEGV